MTITIAVLGSMIIGFVQLRSLDKASASLTQFSVPVFIEAAELERNLKNLLLLLQKADSATQLIELDQLDEDMHKRLVELRSETQAIRALVPLNPDLPDISQALGTIEKTSEQMLGEKRQFLKLSTRISNLKDKLQTNRNATRDLLELMTFNIASEVENRFQMTEPRSTSEPQTLDQLYYQNLIRANAITELALVIEAIIDAALGLDKLSSQDELLIIESNVRFRLRGSVLLMGRLPASDARIQLASEISDLRELVLGQDGLFELVDQSLSKQAGIASFRKAQLQPIQAISEQSRVLSQNANLKVASASAIVKDNSDGLILNLIAAGIVSILTVGCALIFIVERQINKRMARLTHAVLAIAEGDIDHKVEVVGMDELGKMARSLEVFKANAEELHRSNIELEKFAYVAAHDLRSPLRAIQDLSEWVVEDPETKFSHDGKEYMDLLQQRIERLNKLLSDLLEYSRVGKEQDKVVLLSVRDVVDETAGLLDPEDHYNIRFTGNDMPLETFATPLRHTLLNLINNAIKHHDRPTGSIEVHARVDTDCLTCMVRDDGPGISPQYHDRIFNLFQTLRPRDEVEGSGLGLAIIRKLLERHGGKIHVQSDPKSDRGTTFVFVLPRASTATPPYARAA